MSETSTSEEIRENLPSEPDIDLCSDCKEHCSWELEEGDYVSSCCGAGPVMP